MDPLTALEGLLPEAARDLRLNLRMLLESHVVTPAQRWGTAIACAYAVRNRRLADTLVASLPEGVGENVVDDARAAAVLMNMNNVYYRFLELVGKESYSMLPARLRMTRLARPSSNKGDLELFCLAVSALNGCPQCVRSHERSVLGHGITEEQAHTAVRIASTIHGLATALEMA